MRLSRNIIWTSISRYEDDLIMFSAPKNSYCIIEGISRQDLERLNESIPSDLRDAFRSVKFNYDSCSLGNTLKKQDCIGYFSESTLVPLKGEIKISIAKMMMCLPLAVGIACGIRLFGFNFLNFAIGVKPGPFNRAPSKTESEELAYLALLVSRVQIFNPIDNLCLTSSAVFVALARRRGLPARLIIGVKTRPFLSHAWAECFDSVVNDDTELRNKLSVIMEM